MADKRPFFKMDVGYFDNPKIQAIIDEHPRAVLLHARAIAYARQHLTNGIVPLRVVMRGVGASDTDGIPLVVQGLFVDLGDGNVLVHDYEEHNQTAEQVNALSQAQRARVLKRWDTAGTSAGNTAGTSAGNTEKRREDITSELRPDVFRLLDRLDDCIAANGAKKPNRTTANINAARLLLDRDGHDEAEVARVIDWATSDAFWKSNILSMGKLREKFDQLRLKAQSAPATPWQPGPGEMEKFW